MKILKVGRKRRVIRVRLLREGRPNNVRPAERLRLFKNDEPIKVNQISKANRP